MVHGSNWQEWSFIMITSAYGPIFLPVEIFWRTITNKTLNSWFNIYFMRLLALSNMLRGKRMKYPVNFKNRNNGKTRKST